MNNLEAVELQSLKLRKSGLLSSGVTHTSWGEGVSIALIGQPFNNGFTVKISYGVDFLLHQPALHCIG